MANGTVYDLLPGCHYRVRKSFADYYGGAFTQGSLLTFRQREYLPYHSGHTIIFAEQTLYLQDETNDNILLELWTYLEPIPSV
jgi:hypothetical protein